MDRDTHAAPGADVVRTGSKESLGASLFYMQAGLLAFLLGLCGMGAFEWPSLLIGWGVGAFVLGLLMARGSA